ncbi:protein adenylyltransferase SelO [Thalassotalea sp. G2M2-11]|uniref:protein adenylyltransferase SelO n=1 Tax=Thalassotalea sp. G2M2-11 TaxID=2787627 RepID=UPI0019D0E296|nr:YdiU family protein [Thalassotalea sp. G2M2-11]
MSLFACDFNDRFVDRLPADQQSDNFCRTVNGVAYSFVSPKVTQSPTLIALNHTLAQQLTLATDDPQAIARVLTGNELLPNTRPYAMCYGGHQFGHWAGQLGDGRAINLGQLATPELGLQTLQLKGAGPTPYSRTADGLAVLRSSIREYLCSEAMFHLGVPTTRALSLCLTGDKVVRDMFYDGRPQQELGAVVCRVSSSFMRFGSFQLPAVRGDIKLLNQLVDYAITEDFPHLGQPCKDTYIQWFREISERTCQLIVEWMRVGFVHGVMNTDNMSIIGETIDYGPYGWIDNFDLSWTPNTTDAKGKRYCFGAQPQIAQWNLFQLANAIYPLIEQAEPLNEILTNYAKMYESRWLEMMKDKLGLAQLEPQSDGELFVQLEQVLSECNIDMTIFYRLLASYIPGKSQIESHFLPCFYQDEPTKAMYWPRFEYWISLYCQRLENNSLDDDERARVMNRVNPKFVLRNYLAQQAIELAEQGDYSMIEQLQQVLANPYQEQDGFEHFGAKRPGWAMHKAGCSMLSCSS